MHTNPHPARIAPRFLASNALSLLGNSIAAVALPLILLATTGDALAAGTLALICAVPQMVIGVVGGSIGERLYEAKVYFQMTDLLAWTVVIVVCSVGFEKLVLWLLRRGRVGGTVKMDLVISHVYKDFGRGPVLRDVSLTVRQGETVCLMGPSGLGKTTLLRCVAGLERPESGFITGVPERLGYVFQEDRLCDVFSAVANVRLATGRTLPEILRHLEELGLAGSARRPVSQLSGGMRRRVAIARAVCAGPQLLLLDEAFKGLDDQCRRDTVAYIRRHTPGASLLCVTHDPEEAALLGGRCLDLSAL